jgi:hypothetical protein
MHMCPAAGLLHSAHLILVRVFLLLFLQARLDRLRLVCCICGAELVTVEQQVVPEASAGVQAEVLLAVHATCLCFLGIQHPQRFLIDTVPILCSIALPMGPFRSNITGKSLAFSGVGKLLQSGRMRAYLMVLESTEPHKFSDATQAWKRSTYTFEIS